MVGLIDKEGYAQMKIQKNEITLYEFSDEDDIFDVYCGFLRDYENIKMIGRYDYLLSMDKGKIREYLKYMNDSMNDSFFAVEIFQSQSALP